MIRTRYVWWETWLGEYLRCVTTWVSQCGPIRGWSILYKSLWGRIKMVNVLGFGWPTIGPSGVLP